MKPPTDKVEARAAGVDALRVAAIQARGVLGQLDFAEACARTAGEDQLGDLIHARLVDAQNAVLLIESARRVLFLAGMPKGGAA